MEIPRTVCIANQKGGCGKSMTTYNLADCLARAGNRVLVVDLDEQCPHPGLHRIVPKDELPPLAECLKRGDLRPVIWPSEHYPRRLFVTVGDQSVTESEITDEFGREWLLKKALLEPLSEYFDYVLIDTSQAFDLVTLNAILAADLLIIPCDMDRETLRSAVKTIRGAKTFLAKGRPRWIRARSTAF